MRFERHKLIFMGLIALDEVAELCIHEPYPRTFALRVTLAMLYAFSDGNRAPFDLFWQACAAPDASGDPTLARGLRSNAVQSAYHQIFRALGVAETMNLRSDIHAARADPGPHSRHYQALQRQLQSQGEAARQRFAEMLRDGARAHHAVKDEQRKARDCNWGCE